jgi:tetratricopeptide (TPR) repeat protein
MPMAAISDNSYGGRWTSTKEREMAADPTQRDRHDYPISTHNPEAAKKYQEGVDLYMSGNAGSEAALRAAMSADAKFALAPAALAALQMDSRRFDEARENADLARKLAADLGGRERQHVESIATMADGDGPRAYKLMREHLAEFPRDGLILLRAERYLFYSGGAERRQLQRELLESFGDHYDDDWWFPGQYSFTLGELGHFEEAIEIAERSLALNPKNIWAAHTIAHVHTDTKNDEKGAAFLAPWLSDFDTRAPMFGHTSWHLALFELGCGRYDRAMEVYDGCVRPAACKHRSTLNNSASFLWRCKVYGYGVSAEQWDEIQPLAERLAESPRGEWDDLNAALAFAGAGNTAGKDAMVDGLRALATDGKASAGDVAIPLVEAAWAFASEDYDKTIQLMLPAINGVIGIGGSNAQHEVYWDALIEAYLRTSRFAEAEAVQKNRLDPRPTARDLSRLGRIQFGLGNYEEARGYLDQARERWRDADASSLELAAVNDLLRDVAPAG